MNKNSKGFNDNSEKKKLSEKLKDKQDINN
jgi:hypothetical protein